MPSGSTDGSVEELDPIRVVDWLHHIDLLTAAVRKDHRLDVFFHRPERIDARLLRQSHRPQHGHVGEDGMLVIKFVPQRFRFRLRQLVAVLELLTRGGVA
jgi:hypothetical protein